MQMHPDQLPVPLASVRELVDRQFPEWQALSITAVTSAGTVNALFRIGERLVARFPLNPMDVVAARLWLESEAQAARELSGRTRFPTPVPVALGEPGSGYPLPWSVQTWLPGTAAAHEDPGDSMPFAHDLAEFIAGIRALPTRGRSFAGEGRGGELRSHDAWMATCFERSEGLLDVAQLRHLWSVMRELPRIGSDAMTHGDLTPGNILVANGRLAAVIDVGGLGPADPALDLVGAWHLLEVGPRLALREDLRCGSLEWDRGKAWAFVQSMGLVWYYAASNPSMSLMGRRTLQRITADTSG